MFDSQPLRIICVEDDPMDQELVHSALAQDGIACEIRSVTKADELRQALEAMPTPQVVLSDWNIPGFGGLDALKIVRNFSPDLPFILVSGLIGEERAVQLMHQGVTDFVFKNQLNRLGPAVRRVLLESGERNQRKEAERALEESQERLSLAVQSAELGLWDWNFDDHKIIWSSKMESLWGYTPGNPHRQYQDWIDRLHPEDVSRVDPVIRQAIETGTSFSIDFRLIWPDGTIHWMHATGRSYLGADQRPVRMLGVVSDISPRKAAEEQVLHASQHDSLTKLPNRHLLRDMGEQILAGARRRNGRAGLMFVDLDRFKLINDAYGHEVGDKLLQQVATRLRGCLRGEDVVARLGGDEFVAVLATLSDENDVITVAKHTMECLDRPYKLENNTLRVTPSIGISLFPRDGNCIDELIRHADAAMYTAKEAGRNKFRFFSPEIGARASKTLKIERHLRDALEHGQFELHYQPVVDIETLRPVGAEALLRWPALGVPPDQFIPIAESSGLIQPLGDWIFDEVCRQKSDWQIQGMPSFPISVNVSPLQFRHRQFAQKINDAISKRSISPEDIVLEVTEGTLMKNVAEAAGILGSLREIGVKIALDDFGTGYSSLSRLSRLPIDVLKVDQSFIRGFGNDPTNIMITDAIIALGRTLGLELTAEGVETQSALDFIRSRECRHGQGFIFSKPLPPDEFYRWCGQRIIA